MGSLVTLCSSTFSILILAASAGLPKFIVPNLPDLMIKTRRTSGDWLSQVNTLYVKGARQRTESLIQERARANATSSVVIQQCDVKVRTRSEPSLGASTPASVEETDGWYVDLPGLGCQDQTSSGLSFGRLGIGNHLDRLQIKWLGKAPRGYPIEETALRTEAGKETISKVELLEISEAPLNPSLFDLPAGYTLALQTGNGGADLTKPDTISDRAQYYWTRLTFWVRGLFR